MTTFDAGEFTLEQVGPYTWELPKTGEMNVPARVYASEALLEEIAEDKSLEQLRNVTHLPGIYEPAIAMPDAHQGYGFPVGGVAAIDAENGVISPGAIGYDINCLSGETEVALSFGRKRSIADLENDFATEDATVIDDGPTDAPIQLFTADEKSILEIETATGDRIEASPDHPFRTPDGMVEANELTAGDSVSVHPFEGLPDETPPSRTLLTAQDFRDVDPQIREALEERGLLPLKTDDEAFARLLKLVGYHTGDGSFNRERSWFYGTPEDLKAIQDDIEALGFRPSKIYERERFHEIDGNRFERTEYSVRSTARSFKLLLQKLGAPADKKVESNFVVPEYLENLPDWQQALYLSTLFGAELSAPDTAAPKNFGAPAFSHNRHVAFEAEGREFLEGIQSLLSELGIETNKIETVERRQREDGERVRLRFGISADSENLIRFFTTVGYRYAAEKQRRGLQAAQYLKRKRRVINRRAEIATEAKAMADGGRSIGAIDEAFPEMNRRFLERSVYGQRSGSPRPPANFPDFEEYAETHPVEDDWTIPVSVESIEQGPVKPVYDIGVAHEAHNFVVNGFVVSNCGVRMVTTNLTREDLAGREEELVDALFEAIPSGLGAGGVVEGTTATVEAILDRGMEWALEEGYAVPADLEHCEDEGTRGDADPSAVSQEAKDRGRKQIGSLGSGNHFLEVQEVTEVFDAETAAAFGLEAGQIVVLIHCGSRGLGHQVCTDYLREIEQEHADLLESLPDRELAAAPAGSRLAEAYYGAMNAAINYAWVNRQLITYQTRQVFADVFDRDWQALDMDLLYDVAHNIGKKESHEIDGEQREVYVHRKGATRAFPAGHPDVPAAYRDVGQPVIIPGSMGTGSYVLKGGEQSLERSFGSTAHGAGRLMSRTQAKNEFWGEDVQDDLEATQQIYVRAQSGATIAEEAPGVYKDVDEVVQVSADLGIGDPVVSTVPVVNIKG
jgi:tRNA-splicing ligase RtcB